MKFKSRRQLHLSSSSAQTSSSSSTTATTTLNRTKTLPPLTLPLPLPLPVAIPPTSSTFNKNAHLRPATPRPLKLQKKTSPFGVIRHLCGVPSFIYDDSIDHDDTMMESTTPLDDVWSVASKRRGVYNLIQVPHRLERLLFFTQSVCLYDFLSVFTFLPIRFLISILYFFMLFITYPIRFIVRRIIEKNQQQQKKQQENPSPSSPRRKSGKSKSKYKPTSSAQSNDNINNDSSRNNMGKTSPSITVTAAANRRWKKQLVSFAIDFQHVSLLFLTVFVLQMLDTSRIYHSIRGQSIIKLYVIFNAIEIFDRLCSSFGVDMLDSLGWTTASAVSFLLRKRSESPSSSNAVQTVILITRMIFDYMFALAYVIVHATLLLTWVVTLNVSINTKNNALLTLLISNNFVELKGHVFKSFKIPNIFQIACADGVERFQLTTFLALMLIESGGSKELLKTWAVVYVCEIIVDWIKHAFMLKFNRISHRVFRQFGFVVSQGVIAYLHNNNEDSMVRSVGGSAVSKRIGFVSLPLVALVIRMIVAPISKLPATACFVLWLILVCFECVVGICVVGHAWKRVNDGFDDGTEQERERDEYWIQKLMQVERYDLISKN